MRRRERRLCRRVGECKYIGKEWKVTGGFEIMSGDVLCSVVDAQTSGLASW